MMRRLSYLLVLPLLLLSCAKEVESGWNGPVVELTFTTGELATRAGYDGTAEGEDRYNENLISWVDLFFYPDGNTSADATYHVFRQSGKRFSDVMRLELTSEQVNSLIFPSSPDDIRNCTVVAFVNYPSGSILGDRTDLEGTDLASLEQIEVKTDFVMPANHRQPRFLMTGRANLALRGRAQVVAATGTIELRRYACKLTVGVDVSDPVEVTLSSGAVEKWQVCAPPSRLKGWPRPISGWTRCTARGCPARRRASPPNPSFRSGGPPRSGRTERRRDGRQLFLLPGQCDDLCLYRERGDAHVL